MCPSWRTCKEIIEFLFMDFEEWFSLMSLTGSIYIWLSARLSCFAIRRVRFGFKPIAKTKDHVALFSQIITRIGDHPKYSIGLVNLVYILFNGFVEKKDTPRDNDGRYILPLSSEDSASTLTQFPIKLSCRFYGNIWSKNFNWNSQNYF